MAEPSKGLEIGGSRYFWKFRGREIKEDWLKAVKKKKKRFLDPLANSLLFFSLAEDRRSVWEDKIEGPSGTLEGRDTIKQS